MTEFFLGLWLKFKVYIAAAGALFILIAGVFLKGRADGKAAAINKQREVDDAARKRMAAVKPDNSNDVDSKLRDGKF